MMGSVMVVEVTAMEKMVVSVVVKMVVDVMELVDLVGPRLKKKV